MSGFSNAEIIFRSEQTNMSFLCENFEKYYFIKFIDIFYLYAYTLFIYINVFMLVINKLTDIEDGQNTYKTLSTFIGNDRRDDGAAVSSKSVVFICSER